VRYPGPPDQPVVLSLGSRLLRIDRPPVTTGSRAVAQVRLLDESGAVVRSRDVLIPSALLTTIERDSILDRIARAATLGGARELDRTTKSRIEQLVAGISERKPAFGEVALGPAGSLWLSQSGQTGDASGRWLVLDSLFQPVAQALVPSNVTSLAYRDDQTWWATMRGDADVPYVARLQFTESPPKN